MNRRTKIVGVLFVAVVLLALALRHQQPPRPQESLESMESVSPSTNIGVTPGKTQPPATAQVGMPLSNRDDIIIRQAKGMQDLQQRLDRAQDEWRTPIEFYGKAVDEVENPISGAEVNFSCNDLSVNGTSYYNAKSDNRGMFSIDGIKGKLLTVHVSKDGYYSSKRDNDSFYYAGQNVNFVPDPNNPVVFHLLKKGAGEPLIHFHKSFRVPKDGTPILIDLATGDQTSTSQNALKIECWTRNAGKKSGEKYDWKCRVSIVGGGLQLYDKEFPFLAPEANYVPSEEIDMTVKPDMRWQSDIERHYFVRTADGKSGRVIFGMVAGGDHFCVIDSYFNPSGSRNLQP